MEHVEGEQAADAEAEVAGAVVALRSRPPEEGLDPDEPGDGEREVPDQIEAADVLESDGRARTRGVRDQDHGERCDHERRHPEARPRIAWPPSGAYGEAQEEEPGARAEHVQHTDETRKALVEGRSPGAREGSQGGHSQRQDECRHHPLPPRVESYQRGERGIDHARGDRGDEARHRFGSRICPRRAGSNPHPRPAIVSEIAIRWKDPFQSRKRRPCESRPWGCRAGSRDRGTATSGRCSGGRAPPSPRTGCGSSRRSATSR